MKDLFVFDMDPTGTPFRRATQVGAAAGSEGFLLESESAVLLADTGYGCMGERLAERIAAELGDRSLDYILLTHSHYDHAMGTPYCTARWPEAKVVASAYAAGVFQKPGARATMREMDIAAAKMHGILAYQDRVEELRVDREVSDGDVWMMGALQVEAMALPGHTRCSYGYWFPESRCLIASETLGVYNGGSQVTPCFLVGYQMTLDSLARAIERAPEHMLVPHKGFLHGDTCRKYLERAKESAINCKELVVQAFREGKTESEVRQLFKEVYYESRTDKSQPEAAFDLNTGYQIALIRKECM